MIGICPSLIKIFAISLCLTNWNGVRSDTSESKGCHIPNEASLKDLQFRLHPRNETLEFGSHVEPFAVVHVECKNKNTAPHSLLCSNGQWDKNLPTCDGYCDGTVLSGLSLRAVCDVRNSFVKCPKKIEPGTSIQVSCAFGYTRNKKEVQHINCLPDGSFDKKPERCEQDCGRVAAVSTALTKDGTEFDFRPAPWHVFIYEKVSSDYITLCAGTIISPTIVVTAAHCFWDEANQIMRNSANYQIIAGRRTSNYTTEQSDYSQIINVTEIHIPTDYFGREHQHKSDIAYIKLAAPLKYSETIAAICLPKDLRSTAINYVTSNTTGFINGLGVTNEIEKLNVLTLGYHECLEKSLIDAPLADDKFCISSTDGGMICRGGSGAGFYTSSLSEDIGELRSKFLGVMSYAFNVRNDCTRKGDNMAITSIYNTPFEFKDRLTAAREKDEELF